MDAETLKLYTALQPKFKEAMGPLQDDDRVHWPDNTIIPLPIDPKNQERGLFGMISGDISILRVGTSWAVRSGRGAGRVLFSYGEIPELALLKALAHQWNVEVK